MYPGSSSLFLLGFVGFLCILPASVFSYVIDAQSCATHNTNDIRLAAEEALNMAAYASFRMRQNDPRVGTDVLRHLLGPRAKDLLINRMDAVAPAVGRYRGAYGTIIDETVVIDCGRTHLFWSQAYQGFLDNRFPGIVLDPPPGLPQGSHPCQAANTGAFTYGTEEAPGSGQPHHVIVLCDGPPPHALANRMRIDQTWRDQWREWPLDHLKRYVSETFVHEFMHVLDLPAILPVSQRAEVGTWANIGALQDADKEVNAEGYAMLASAFWLRYNTIGANGQMGRKFSVNNRPAAGPHF